MRTVTLNIDPAVDGNVSTVIAFVADHLDVTAEEARALAGVFQQYAADREEEEDTAEERAVCKTLGIEAPAPCAAAVLGVCRVLFADPAVESFTAPKNGTDFQIDELQGVVGGYFEIIPLGDQRIMVLNEDGKARKLPVNAAATKLAHEHRAISHFDFIVGDALVCPVSMVK